MADVPVLAPAAAEAAPAGKSKKTLIIVILLAVVLLAGGGVGAWFAFVPHGKKTKVAKQEPPAPALYVALDPPFVVNFEDQDSTRYLQIGVTVMTHDPVAVQAMKDSDPVIRNALVMLFSAQTYAGLSDTAGKEKLQAQALTAVRKIVADKTGKPAQVDALYFTSFVMQ